MKTKSMALLIGAVGALTAVPASAEDLQVQFGAVTYQFYCVSCHGTSGKGDGPIAGSLPRPPADLTRLADKNGGDFPVERVSAAIDGRVEVVGHTGVAMPPWGQLFAHELEEFPEGTVVETMIARRIARIIAYLMTIQER